MGIGLDWIGWFAWSCVLFIYILFVYPGHFLFFFVLFISHWYSTTMYPLTFSLSIYLSTIIQMSFEAS